MTGVSVRRPFEGQVGCMPVESRMDSPLCMERKQYAASSVETGIRLPEIAVQRDAPDRSMRHMRHDKTEQNMMLYWFYKTQGRPRRHSKGVVHESHHLGDSSLRGFRHP